MRNFLLLYLLVLPLIGFSGQDGTASESITNRSLNVGDYEQRFNKIVMKGYEVKITKGKDNVLFFEGSGVQQRPPHNQIFIEKQKIQIKSNKFLVKECKLEITSNKDRSIYISHASNCGGMGMSLDGKWYLKNTKMVNRE